MAFHNSTRALLDVDEPSDRSDDPTYYRGALAFHILRGQSEMMRSGRDCSSFCREGRHIGHYRRLPRWDATAQRRAGRRIAHLS